MAQTVLVLGSPQQVYTPYSGHQHRKLTWPQTNLDRQASVTSRLILLHCKVQFVHAQWTIAYVSYSAGTQLQHLNENFQMAPRHTGATLTQCVSPKPSCCTHHYTMSYFSFKACALCAATPHSMCCVVCACIFSQGMLATGCLQPTCKCVDIHTRWHLQVVPRLLSPDSREFLSIYWVEPNQYPSYFTIMIENAFLTNVCKTWIPWALGRLCAVNWIWTCTYTCRCSNWPWYLWKESEWLHKNASINWNVFMW